MSCDVAERKGNTRGLMRIGQMEARVRNKEPWYLRVVLSGGQDVRWEDEDEERTGRGD